MLEHKQEGETIMDVIDKELAKTKEEIKGDIEGLFHDYMKIGDWDIPEANDQELAQKLLKIFQDKLAEIAKDVADGKYKNY